MRSTNTDVNLGEVSWTSLKQLWPYLFEFKSRIFFALACLVLAKLASIGLPFILKDVVDSINPETSKPWRKAEVQATMNTEELGDLKLTSEEIDAIVAFMKTFTDRRYEHLL